MITIQGKGVYGAIAIGTLSFFSRNESQVKRERVADSQTEVTKFHQAREKAKEELSALYQKAILEIGETNAQIFEIHQMMLDDLDFIDAVTDIIQNQQTNAAYAVAVTADNFSVMFQNMEDAYMQERAADVQDVSNRILHCLEGTSMQQSAMKGQQIICAEDLVPSETVQLDKQKVLAFVTKKGSVNSHTAILARTMNIPAVIGVGECLKESYDGKMAIVDGYTGEIFIEPDTDTLKRMKEKQQEDETQRTLLQTLKGKENITLDGRKIEIYANIGGLSDLGAVLLNDAGGIGLFRSEFLYLENKDFPSEELQFATYKKVLESMAGKKVIIRTLDIGADKQISYFGLDKEENPALGYRAIRICLSRQDIFKTQLRALYRASVYGRLSIMFPMIVSKEEILKTKEIINAVQQELKKQDIPFSENVEIGIMIETPAAAILSDVLAPEVDFFSIGTNDLTQYTLAADRQNSKLDEVYNPHHEAVFRLIQYTIQSAHKNNIWVGVCGELGADTTVTERLLQMGVDELSVSPSLVLSVRDQVRKSRAT